MCEVALNETGVNEMILDLMENKEKHLNPDLTKNKKKKKRKTKKDETNKKEETEETDYKKQIKNNLKLFVQEQQQIYKNEEMNLQTYIKSEIEQKEKELNKFYEYCQNFKKSYKDNFNDVMQNSEEIKKELKDLHIDYLDKKILLENERRMELKTASDFYKKKLLEVKDQWDNKTYCDDNLKTLVFDILNVMD